MDTGEKFFVPSVVLYALFSVKSTMAGVPSTIQIPMVLPASQVLLPARVWGVAPLMEEENFTGSWGPELSVFPGITSYSVEHEIILLITAARATKTNSFFIFLSF
jgi:hypothetical protein